MTTAATKEPTKGPLDAALVAFFGQLSAFTTVLRAIAGDLIAEGRDDDARRLRERAVAASETFHAMIGAPPGGGLETFEGELDTSTDVVAAIASDLDEAGIHSYARPLDAARQNVERAFAELRREVEGVSS